MKDILISVDIGGMSYKGALVTFEGEILYKERIKASEYGNKIKFIKDIKTLLNNLIKAAKVKDFNVVAMGFSVPGVIDSDNGIIKYSNNIKLENVMFKEELSEYNLPIFMLNDANAATLGEARVGVAKNYNNVVFLTLGTGVGGGAVINGKLYAGMEGTGAEHGHMVIRVGGHECTCGRKGCFEAYASATALLRYTKEYLLKYKDSKMWQSINNDINNIDGSTAFETLKKYNDKAAKLVVNKYVKYLSEGILNLCNIFRPEIILLGGGVSEQGDYLINMINKYCIKYHYGFKSTPIPIIKAATLKNDAGIIGAAFFAIENMK